MKKLNLPEELLDAARAVSQLPVPPYVDHPAFGAWVNDIRATDPDLAAQIVAASKAVGGPGDQDVTFSERWRRFWSVENQYGDWVPNTKRRYVASTLLVALGVAVILNVMARKPLEAQGVGVNVTGGLANQVSSEPGSSAGVGGAPGGADPTRLGAEGGLTLKTDSLVPREGAAGSPVSAPGLPPAPQDMQQAPDPLTGLYSPRMIPTAGSAGEGRTSPPQPTAPSTSGELSEGSPFAPVGQGPIPLSASVVQIRQPEPVYPPLVAPSQTTPGVMNAPGGSTGLMQAQPTKAETLEPQPSGSEVGMFVQSQSDEAGAASGVTEVTAGSFVRTSSKEATPAEARLFDPSPAPTAALPSAPPVPQAATELPAPATQNPPPAAPTPTPAAQLPSLQTAQTVLAGYDQTEAITAQLDVNIVTVAGVGAYARAVDQKGGVWIGVASIDAQRRISIEFGELVHEKRRYPIKAIAYDAEHNPGLRATYQDQNPTLVEDIFRQAVSGANAYVQGLGQSGNTSVLPGGVVVDQKTAPPIEWVVASEVSKLFNLPVPASNLIRTASVARGTPILIYLQP